MQRRAFTLVEAIVVIVLIGVIAGLAAPRLMRNDARRADVAIESLAGVLGVIAQREALGTLRMALVYDGLERTVSLERLELPTDDEGRLQGLSRRDNGQWKSDPLAQSVSLDPVRIDEVRVEGDRIDDDEEWRVEFVPGEPRPLIEMDLVANISGRERTWSLELLPYATEASQWITTNGRRRDKAALRSTDLDALNLSDVPW